MFDNVHSEQLFLPMQSIVSRLSEVRRSSPGAEVLGRATDPEEKDHPGRLAEAEAAQVHDDVQLIRHA